jgi:hypothetical protein
MSKQQLQLKALAGKKYGMEGTMVRSLADQPLKPHSNAHLVLELLRSHMDVTSLSETLTSSQQLTKVITFLKNIYQPIEGETLNLAQVNTVVTQQGPLGLAMNQALLSWKEKHWQEPYKVDSDQDRHIITNFFSLYIEEKKHLTPNQFLVLPKTHQDELIKEFKGSESYRLLLNNLSIVPEVATYFKVVDQIQQLGPWSFDLNHDSRINWEDVDAALLMESVER